MLEVRDGHDCAERRVLERPAHDVLHAQLGCRLRQKRDTTAGCDERDDGVNVRRFLDDVCREPCLDTRSHDLIVNGRDHSPCDEDERLSREVVERHGAG